MTLGPFPTLIVLAAAALATIAVTPAQATESGAGHYIVGTYAAPGAGIVPPQPGVYWSNTNLYYGASASNSLRLPVAGAIAAGLRTDFSSFAFTGLYVPKLDLGPFTLAAAITLPGQYMNTQGDFGARSRTDTSGGFGDMVITPAIVGWHSGGNFAQARLDIFAPTGPYKLGSLANIGMNYWTFTPTLAYTHIDPASGVSASASLGVDFNTRNAKTGYQSGTALHLDTTVIKTFGESGFGLGLLGSLFYQISDDSGGLAAQLGGFRGRTFAVGPVASYAFKLGDMAISSSLRWAPEFGVQKRLSGNAVYVSLAGKF